MNDRYDPNEPDPREQTDVEYKPEVESVPEATADAPVEPQQEAVEPQPEAQPIRHERPKVPYINPCTAPTKDSSLTLGVPMNRMTGEEGMAMLTDFVKKLKADDNLKTHGSDAELLQWMLEVIRGGTFHNDEYTRSFDRQDSNWSQGIHGEKGEILRIGTPKLSLNDSADRLTGVEALRFISQASGIGTTMRVPLWHSGLILTLESFRERSVLDLATKLSNLQVELGTATNGSCFTGDDVYVVNTIIDFVLSHVIGCNVKGYTTDMIRDLMLVPDIMPLLAGALAAMYPKGYPAYHQCNNIAKGCSYNIQVELASDGNPIPDSMIDFKKMVWTDDTTLTTKDRIHMSTNGAVHTVADVKDYQARRAENIEHKGVVLSENNGTVIKAFFKVPTVNEYKEHCSAWVSSLVEMIDNTLAIDRGVDDKERLEKRHEAMLTYSMTLDLLKSLNWYSHMQVIVDDQDPRIIDDLETMRKTLDIFVSKEGLSTRVESELQAYKEDVTISMTGLPNFICPWCKASQVEPGERYSNLIPVNMVGYFFTIMAWRSATHVLNI